MGWYISKPRGTSLSRILKQVVTELAFGVEKAKKYFMIACANIYGDFDYIMYRILHV